MKSLWDCHRSLLRGFYHYGYFLASHPAWFLTIPIGLCLLSALGFMNYNPETDIETLYAPTDSRAVKDRDTVVKTFPDLFATNYHPFSANKLMAQGIAIFRSKAKRAILTPEVLHELETFRNNVLLLRVQVDGQNITFEDVCVRSQTFGGTDCVVDGDFLFDHFFNESMSRGEVNYPFWFSVGGGIDLNLFISDVVMSDNDEYLKAAGAVKMAFPLRQDTKEVEKMSLAWELEFANLMKNANFSTVDYAYAISQSLSLELDRGTKGDIFYFSLTFTMMITYASVVSAGGDCVSTRALLANAGVVAAAVGIMGAFGLVTLTGVRFVNMVGIMPFLTLGIGVDDMFLLMGTWSEITAIKDISIEERIGLVFKKAGVGITITSLTDFLAFVVGSLSVFKSVKNFCIYTGVGVLLCYVCNATFFAACLTYHGRRVYSGRHTITCKKVGKSRAELSREGHCCCHVCLFGGAVPSGPNDDQSLCEKAPKYFLTNFILYKPVRFVILLLFAGYLGVSLWGCTKLKQGLDLKNLVLESSYFHKYQVWDTENFGVKVPIAFVTTSEKDYTNISTLMNMYELLTKSKDDPYIDKTVDNCWLTSFYKTSYYNSTDDDVFFDGLKTFLALRPSFQNDLVFGADNRSIVASRCHAYSIKVVDSNDQANLMTRMRDLADASPADVFAYHPAFVYFEQYLSILPGTLQTVGVTLAVMFVVTCIFIPQPMIVVIVMVQVIMIVTGIFGFMAHWGLTLSSVTMIHLIMSVGFSVDFCAHVCTAYIVSEKQSREDRAKDAIVHASGPIFNGGLSSIIGVVVLLFTESYIFQSFFKIMVLVIGFGVLHAVFLIPVVLSFIGPTTYVDLEEDSATPHFASKTSGGSKQKNGEASLTKISSINAATLTNERPLSDHDLQLGYLPREKSR